MPRSLKYLRVVSFLNKQELVFGMSSGLDLRKRIVRKDPPNQGGKGKLNPSPLSAIDAGSPGEIRIANDHMYALAHLYHASPSGPASRRRAPSCSASS